jgi:tRNA(fMet)-specific endonuclease VapC
MTPLYMLDTNIASYAIKGNIPRVRQRLTSTPMHRLCISVITEAELRFGVARFPEAPRLGTAVEEFLLRVNSLAWDSASAREYARLRTELESKGIPIGNLDLMIAAHALSTSAVLVTHDRVFGRIRSIVSEDWT